MTTMNMRRTGLWTTAVAMTLTATVVSRASESTEQAPPPPVTTAPVTPVVVTDAETLPADPAAAPAADAPRIQVAILLDTSGSMSGLIEQAKQALWLAVNEFATARRDGQRPVLQVALYHYGSPELGDESGYIRQLAPLTDDLDLISEQLFALRTSGGDEYCGQVIQTAVNELDWSADHDDLKTIYIAGNEAFTQGSVDYREACQAAISRGITINTIHCGNYEQGISGMWQRGALLAEGTYLHIDQNQQVRHIPAPQDARIAELSVALNDTYVPYGERGRLGAQRQVEQDASNVMVSEGNAVQRALSKSSMHYQNAAWDLVDAIDQDKVELEDVKAEDLPEAMREMTLEQCRAYLDAQRTQRAEIRKEMAELNKARQAYVTEKQRELADAGEDENTLNVVMTRSLREQAAEKAFTFSE